jgi:hypothetical protein
MDANPDLGNLTADGVDGRRYQTVKISISLMPCFSSGLYLR